MKYRKKPVTIEAYQTDVELDIPTLEGTMHASVGDYIITGIHGEQYPCKPDIFLETYEPTESDTDATQARQGVVEDLQSENAKLRVERDEWHRVAESKQDIIDHMRDANAENAKLKELVRIAIKHCDSGTCDGCPIMGEDESCPYADMARELRVEVDDG